MEQKKIYTYLPQKADNVKKYDQATAAASMQGIYNRENGPCLYFFSDDFPVSKHWFDVFTGEGEWLHGREQVVLEDFKALVDLTRPFIKGVVVFDPSVAATVNVACTIAGVEDRVVLSPELFEEWKDSYAGLPVTDLRGKFDGSETGSAKNDAYRWAIREYLAKGKCSKHFMSLFADSYYSREQGDVCYVVTRDWPIYQRAFVYDLSPWPDEVPSDDENQPLGTDYATYLIMLEEQKKQTAGKELTEVNGFFSFVKYSNWDFHKSVHEPVPTEWQTVWLITPYNCYQNTATENCLNQSLHCQYGIKQLKQNDKPAPKQVENKCYLCFHFCDYDSTRPVYEFLPDQWADSERGDYPIAWGIDPNLCESYPDLFEYFYRTRSANDYFVGDASAAGYFNPSRVPEDAWEMVTEHNKRFYKLCDMSISPMVLDQEAPSDRVKDQFLQFSKDGYATVVMDLQGIGARAPEPHVWKGMTVDEMISVGDNNMSSEAIAQTIAEYGVKDATADAPFFRYCRVIWVAPSHIRKAVDKLREMRPDLDIEVVGPYEYFQMYGDILKKQGKFQG